MTKYMKYINEWRENTMMNEEDYKEDVERMKKDYSVYLHETARGKADLQASLAGARQFRIATGMPLGGGGRYKYISENTTENTKKNLHKMPKCFTEKLIHMKVEPIGLPMCCFSNTQFFEKIHNFERRLGYTPVSCLCGRTCSMELHSVSYKNGKYYDFTRDALGEKEKYFFPIGNSTMNETALMKVFGKTLGAMIYEKKKGKKCSCPKPPQADTDTYDGYEEFVKEMEELGEVQVEVITF